MLKLNASNRPLDAKLPALGVKKRWYKFVLIGFSFSTALKTAVEL